MTTRALQTAANRLSQLMDGLALFPITYWLRLWRLMPRSPATSASRFPAWERRSSIAALMTRGSALMMSLRPWRSPGGEEAVEGRGMIIEVCMMIGVVGMSRDSETACR